MRQLSVRRDDVAFQAEVRRSGNGKVPPASIGGAAVIPPGATVLVGDRSPQFGGGLASTGYVMHAGKAVASIAVSATDVQRGWLTIG